MQNKYIELIETVIKREYGILGKQKTDDIAQQLNIELASDGSIISIEGDGKKVLNDLLEKLGNAYGLWSVLGCKIAVLKAARNYGLELPEVLKH